MVGGHHGIARIEQSLADGAEVGHSLGIVAVPRAAVDVDDNRVTLLLLFGEIDVEAVIDLAVSGIVHIGVFP